MNDNDREYRAMLASIVDNSEDAIISKDLNGIITSWNRAAEQIFGFSADEMIGQPILRLIPKNRQQEEEMILSLLRRGQRIAHFETVRCRKSGDQLPVSLSISPIINKQGEIIGASKIARDITKQVAIQQRLENFARRLQLINTIGKKILQHLDMQSILEEVIDTTRELCDADFAIFCFQTNDESGNTRQTIARSVNFNEPHVFSTPCLPVFLERPAGKTIFRSGDLANDFDPGNLALRAVFTGSDLLVASAMMVVLKDLDGQVAGSLLYGAKEKNKFDEEHEALIEGIAAQAYIALENARLFEEIRILSQKKDEFIGFASHELKTPLTTLSGFVQLLEMSPDLLQEYIPVISKQVSRLSALVSNLLDVSKIRAGKLSIQFSPTSLRETVREATESIRPIASSHELIVALGSDELWAEADEGKITQVIVNLLSNAIKYSPGNAQIRISARQAGKWVEVAVTDKGIGIAPEHLSKIFHQFYQVSDNNTATGFGVGLFICEEIILAHHGRIWAESQLGEGATFTFRIPVSQTEIS